MLPPVRPAVLLVDDDRTLLSVLSRRIERAGYNVLTAASGPAALNQLEAGWPALLVIDLMMPEMDGFELAAELHRRSDWREIPVVVITARDLTAADHERLSGFVERVVQKGALDTEGLLTVLRELVQAHLVTPMTTE